MPAQVQRKPAAQLRGERFKGFDRLVGFRVQGVEIPQQVVRTWGKTLHKGVKWPGGGNVQLVIEDGTLRRRSFQHDADERRIGC